MSSETIYSPPQTDPVLEDEGVELEYPLASRGRRFVAALIDRSLEFMPLFVGMMVYLSLTPDVIPEFGILGSGADVWIYLFYALCLYVIHVLMQGYLLARYGQTIGKHVMEIKITTLDGEKPSLGRLLFARSLSMVMMHMLSPSGVSLGLLDDLFIFRKNRRCLHDMIAGTQVLSVHGVAERGSRWRTNEPPLVFPELILASALRQDLAVEPHAMAEGARWVEDLGLSAERVRDFQQALALKFPAASTRLSTPTLTYGELLQRLEIPFEKMAKVPGVRKSGGNKAVPVDLPQQDIPPVRWR